MTARRFLIDGEGNIVPFPPGGGHDPFVHEPYDGIEFDDEGMPPFKNMPYNTDLVEQPNGYWTLPPEHPAAVWIRENGHIYARSGVQESEVEDMQ